MWEYEYTVDTQVRSDRLWAGWADLASWPQWNDGIATISIDGPFAVGTQFVMTSPDGEPIALRIVEVDQGRSFTDELDAGDFVVRTTHALRSGPDTTTITYRTEITGAAADKVGPELGPQITADFADVIAALIRHVEV